MKQIKSPLPEKHIFVCINEREIGRDCCSRAGGMEVFRKIKSFIMSNGLASRIWVTKTGCQGFCNNVGTTITIYPEQKILTEVNAAEVEGILEEALKE